MKKEHPPYHLIPVSLICFGSPRFRPRCKPEVQLIRILLNLQNTINYSILRCLALNLLLGKLGFLTLVPNCSNLLLPILSIKHTLLKLLSYIKILTFVLLFRIKSQYEFLIKFVII